MTNIVLFDQLCTLGQQKGNICALLYVTTLCVEPHPTLVDPLVSTTNRRTTDRNTATS